jgi:radical SAM superfamily enzyme YgiQ (UPF0313 family)
MLGAARKNLTSQSQQYLPSVMVPQDATTDILLLNMPLTLTETPWTAGAVLKSVASSAGYSCSTVDVNCKTLQWIKHHPKALEIKNFFWGGTISSEIFNEIDQYFNAILNIIRQYNPKILGLSVFTDMSRVATISMTTKIRQQLPDIKIIMGGHGISNSFDYVPDSVCFGEKLKQHGLTDYYILGDAELAFKEFLSNNLNYPGINQSNWQQLNNQETENVPYPDYTDYDWSLYPQKLLGITGSRGCVRACTFCDYIAEWKKYTWRSADSIFDEMLHQKQKYGINNFTFSDSLINGNLKEYTNLVTKLSEYNLANPTNQFRWNSFFIFRPIGQFGERLWRLTALSGCIKLVVGIESFNDKTRFAMGKKFTNQDVDDNLALAIKYNVHVGLLCIIGYVSDTQETIDESLAWLDARQHLKKYFTLSFQQTLMILPGSWLDENRETVKIKLIRPDDWQGWINTETGSTLEIREAWLKQVLDHAASLGYSIIDDGNVHKWLEDLLDGKQWGAWLLGGPI